MTLRIGIMGGMFDPVHNGHIQVALTARRILGLDHVRLVPCGVPSHRDHALCSALQRLDMLQLAVAGRSELVVDDRELNRPGTSYSFDTVASIRAEFEAAVLFFILGADAFAGLAGWYRWQDLFDLCHLIVINRPGAVPEPGSEVGREAAARRAESVESLFARRAGLVFRVDEPAIFISSSEVRQRIARQDDLADLVAPAVAEYLSTHKLYTKAVTGP